jgi:cytoskeletal protein CcmA (bactofilin family)
MKQYILYGVLLGFAVLPHAVSASPIVRSGDTVTVSAEQVLESDFYGFGNTVSLSGEAQEDVYVVGGSVTVNAPVAKDLTVIGFGVRVHGEVADDLRIIGGEVELAQPIKGDVVVLGGSLTILSTASVEGDVIFLAGSAVIDGSVKGSILGTADTIRIDAPVGGTVDVRAISELSLGDRAEIAGDVHYTSVSELVRAQEATIGGDVKKIATPAPVSDTFFRDLVLQILVMLFAALMAFLMLRPVITRVVDGAAFSYGTHALVGVGVFIALPFVSMLLMASVLGLVVGISLMCAYVLLIISSWVLTGIVLGSKIQEIVFQKEGVTILTVVLGTVLFNLVMAIPFIGFFIAMALTLIVQGSIVLLGYRALR